MDQLISPSEAASPAVPFLTINSVAPTIMAYGTDEGVLLPKIAAGDIHFSIGYLSRRPAPTHEPSRTSKTVRDGDVTMGQRPRRCGPA